MNNLEDLMISLIYQRECLNLSKWHSFKMLLKIYPNSVLWGPLMNTPLQPVGMDHSHTSTIHLTTISSSMLVSDMMPPKHLLPLREGMSMQFLVLRTSTPLKNPTKHISLRILTPHQMTSIRYIRPNIAETPHTFIWFPKRSLQETYFCCTQETICS